MGPGDAFSRGEMVESLADWLKRNMRAGRRACEPPNNLLLDNKITWNGAVMDGLVELGLRCTDNDPQRRPPLQEIKSVLKGLVSAM